MTAERRFQRGQVSQPQNVPSLDGRPSVASEAKKPFPRSKLLDGPEAPRQQPQKPSIPSAVSPRLPEIPSQDAYNYLAKLIERGLLTPEQGMKIMGRSEQERTAIINNIQANEKREEAVLKELGIFEQAKRLEEIQKELVKEKTPIEDGREGWQEWRSNKDLSPMSFGKRLLTLPLIPLSIFGISQPLTDIIVVDNADGTQTKYVDRALTWRHKHDIVDLKPGVYKETYGPHKRFKGRKLLSRELVGDAISIDGWAESTTGEPEREYSVITTKYRTLLKEQANIERQMTLKQREHIFSKIKMGDAEYTATKMEQIQKKSLEDGITRMLWSVKDSPKEKLIFAGRNIASSALFYSLFQTVLPHIEQFGPLGKGILGGGYSLFNQFALFNPREVATYIKEHPIATTMQVATMVLFFINPLWGAGALLATQLLTPLLAKGKLKAEKMIAARKFKRDNPEITDRKARKAAFAEEYPKLHLDKELNKFLDRNKGWLEELRRLNPGVPDDTLRQAMLVKTQRFFEETQELNQINSRMATKFLNAVLPRYLALPLTILGSLALSSLGVPPVVSEVISSALTATVATTLQIKLTEDSMRGIKNEVAEKFPNLIPENQRQTRRLAKQAS